MSAIAGLLRRDGGPAEPHLIRWMMSRLRHRGPEGLDYWVEGSVALGHGLLRTTPESTRETQPLLSQDGALVLTFDGRIDNRSDLITQLSGRSIRPRNDTDAELVLCAYQLWGAECPCRLLGDFAFAIWDQRQKNFFCARDHFGVKPFYYFVGTTHVAFASEEEAFFDVPGMSTEPNELLLASALEPSFFNLDDSRSWLRDVIKLPPGNSAIIDRSGKIDVSSYWRLAPLPELKFSTAWECAEALRSLLNEAVRCRSRSLSPPSLMLSGGIDSASIAAVAWSSENSVADRLRTFSFVSDDELKCHETRNIRKIVSGHESDASLMAVSGRDRVITDADLKDAAWSHAHPCSNTVLLPAMVYLAARRAGCNVTHDGVDGDLTMYVPTYYMNYGLRAGHWRWAFSEIWHASQVNTYLHGQHPLRILSRSLLMTYGPESLKRIVRSLRKVGSERQISSRLIGREFAAQLQLEERIEAQGRLFREADARGAQAAYIHAVTRPGISASMEGFDPVAARYGVEARHPWSDRRLIEFHLQLPTELKANQGWSKYALRSAVAPLLAADVVWDRNKHHLGFDLTRRLLTCSRDEIAEASVASRDLLGGLINREAARRLFQSAEGGIDDRDVVQLFAVTTLVHWIKRLRNQVSPQIN